MSGVIGNRREAGSIRPREHGKVKVATEKGAESGKIYTGYNKMAYIWREDSYGGRIMGGRGEGKDGFGKEV